MEGMQRRRSGVILHVTSLASPHGIGDLGPSAYRFADFLSRAKQSCWQFLPLTPTQAVSGYSPYSSIAAFAGNTLLISPELVREAGLLTAREEGTRPAFPGGKCDFARAVPHREGLLNLACDPARRSPEVRAGFERFCEEQAGWLHDFALFLVIKRLHGGKAWGGWDEEVRRRDPGALERVSRDHAGDLERVKFLQYLFHDQWGRLRRYCNEKGIVLIGDIPIYVSYDSVDAWAHADIFKLNGRGRPDFVAGVPPDYFSATGQLWGNPVYHWDRLRATGFDWWIRRVEHTLTLFDVVRIDHFRGLVSYWEVPATEKTAINGCWVEVPAVDFFTALTAKLPELPLIAEDLGIITDEVREVMRRFNFPGMRVLLFAFGEDSPHHSYLPHSYIPNCAAYTGTHDNNTVRGWIDHEARQDEKMRLFRYLGREVPSAQLHVELIRLLMMSVANTVIFPLQDMLGLGREARMNCPGIPKGNWTWRLSPEQLSAPLAGRFAEMTRLYGRE